MKSIKILFVTLLLLNLGLAHAQFNTFSMDKKGDVKSISQNNYYPLDINEPKKGFYVWNEGENYSTTGRENSWNSTKAVKVAKIPYQFDEDKVIEENFPLPFYEERKEGDKIFATFSLDTILYSHAIPYKKDDRGNVAEAKVLDKSGKIIFIEKFVYDAENNCLERNRYDADGNLIFAVLFVYLYDAQGNWKCRTVILNGKLYCVNMREIIYY
ncbi:MAG: hypothetical protein KBA86_08375 [Bacteroidales bacterium]|nr:hypothetical protein [Bacteroidales bacterium]